MKTSLLLLTLLGLASPGFAADGKTGNAGQTKDKADKIYPPTAAEPEREIKVAVQLTEVGCMRTLLLLTSDAQPYEKLLAQRLTDVDFRVFPSATVVPKAPSAAEMRRLGDENLADLVLSGDVTTREKGRFGEFQLFEGEATVEIYSPVSGELMVTQTSRVTGTRSIDPVDAKRSAAEKALDMATREAIAKGLEKAHKFIVHNATITGVKDNNQLLVIKEHIAKMDGVYHVRQLSFNLAQGVAVLEIISSPKAEEFWRAWLEKMPRARIVLTIEHAAPPRPSAARRSSGGADGVPAWFKKDAAN